MITDKNKNKSDYLWNSLHLVKVANDFHHFVHIHRSWGSVWYFDKKLKKSIHVCWLMRHSWKETNLSHPCRTSWTPNEVFLRDCQTLPCWLPTWTPGRKELKWKEQPLLIIRWLHRSIWRISKKVKLQWKANYTLKSISPLLSESNLSKYEFIKNIFLQIFPSSFFLENLTLQKSGRQRFLLWLPTRRRWIFHIKIYYYILYIKIYY